MTLDQLKEMRIRIEWDIAWQIFEKVNENNDILSKLLFKSIQVNSLPPLISLVIISIAAASGQGS